MDAMSWGTVNRVDVHVCDGEEDTLVLSFARGEEGEVFLSADVRSLPSQDSAEVEEVPYYWPYDDPKEYWTAEEYERQRQRDILEEYEKSWRARFDQARKKREEEQGRARDAALALISKGETLSSYEVAAKVGVEPRVASVALRRLVLEGVIEPYTEEKKRRYRPT